MTPVPIDSEFGKWIITLGVGGILAFIMFMFYRKDVRQYTELWKAQTEVLMMVVKENTTAHVANTTSNQSLVNMVGAFHRRLDVQNVESAFSRATAVTDLIQEILKPEHGLIARLQRAERPLDDLKK